MDRQIAEAVEMKEEIEEASRKNNGELIIRNGKTEYNRCILLGITRVPNEKDKEKLRDISLCKYEL